MSTPNETIGVLFETCEQGPGDLLTPEKLGALLVDEQSVIVLGSESWTDGAWEQKIRKACSENGLSHVVICGPSPESSQVPDWIELDDRDEAVGVVHAAIKEHVSVTGKDDREAVEKIERLVRMAIARLRGSAPLKVIEKPVVRKVLVTGANHAAFETADRLADSGLSVVLLQGNPTSGCVYPLSEALVERVQSSRNIQIIKNAQVQYVDGGVGDFHVEIESSCQRRYLKVGAIVVAVDLDTVPGPLLAGLDDDRIVSLKHFARETSDKDSPRDSVCILLDQRPDERICASKAAVRFAHEHVKAGGMASIIAKHMPVYGTRGQDVYDEARSSGVRFLRVDKEPVIEKGRGCLTVTVTDTVLPEKQISLQVDRIVVPSAMGPSGELARLAHVLHQPRDLMGYLQSGNVRHRPVGSARRGVFFVGGCHDQCDPVQAALEAQAVVGQLVAQLPGDKVRVASEKIIYDTGHCARCLNCVRACPHGAIHPDEDGHWVQLLDAACWQCGICASVCPGLALEHGTMRFEQIHRTLHVATAKLNQTAPVIAFACRQGALRALDEAGRLGLQLPQDLLVIDVPCAGLVSDRILLDAIEQGARSVMVLGCHHDNCRSLWGSDLTGSRVEELGSKLAALGVDRERIRFYPVAANEAFRLINLLGNSMDEFPEGPALEPGAYREVSGDKAGQEVSHG